MKTCKNNYVQNNILVQEKTYGKVRSIKDNLRVVVEFYLPDGEILRELNDDMSTIVREMGLAEVGAEIYFTVVKTGTELLVGIEPYVQEYDQELEDTFKEIEELIGD